MAFQPKFMSGVNSHNMRVTDTDRNQTLIVNLRPTSRAQAYLYVTELFSGKTLGSIPSEIEIFDHNIGENLNMSDHITYVPLNLSHSYTISYKGEVLIMGFILSNGHTSLLSSLFTFPPTEEEETKDKMSYYTLLLKGNAIKGSNVMTLSSTVGLEEGRSIMNSTDDGDYDEDDEEDDTGYIFITKVDHKNNKVTVNMEFTKTCSNVTVIVR